MQVVQRVQRLLPDGDPPAFASHVAFFPGLVTRSHGDYATDLGRAWALLGADVVAFLVAALCGFCISWKLHGLDMYAAAGQSRVNSAPWLVSVVAACALVAGVSVLATRGHYTHGVAIWTRLRDLLLASCIAFATSATASFLLAAPMSRLLMFAVAFIFPPTALGLRWCARAGLDAAGRWRIPVVVIGTDEWVEKAAEILQSERELGYTVTACVKQPRADFLAGPQAWTRVLRSHGARLLVLANGAGNHFDPALIAALVRERVPYALLPEGTGLPMVGATRISLAQDATLVCYRNNLNKPLARALKVAFDVVAAGALLVAVAPVMLIVAGLVKLDGGPVLFSHKRIGAYGRTFRCFKFRSMVIDGETVLQDLFAKNPAAREEWMQTHKLRRDPRVTWIGKILRKTSLDELPQLLNVLRLEMSLVGPRPIVSQEIPKYGADIAYYYETRPGITGLWQVSGRSDTTYAYRVHLDSWYVKNWTLWRDLSILVRTIPAVLSARGAG